MKVINKTINKHGNIESVIVDHNGDRFELKPLEYLFLSLEGHEDVEESERSNYTPSGGGTGITIGV